MEAFYHYVPYSKHQNGEFVPASMTMHLERIVRQYTCAGKQERYYSEVITMSDSIQQQFAYSRVLCGRR